MTSEHEFAAYYTVTEACTYLRVSKSTLYDLMADGRLPFFRIKGTRKRRFKRTDLDALIEQGNPTDPAEDDEE